MVKKQTNAIREKLGDRSIYWLAQETGISYSLLHSYISGKREPRMENLSKIAHALGVKVRDLIAE